jgi:hypothetical protein
VPRSARSSFVASLSLASAVAAFATANVTAETAAHAAPPEGAGTAAQKAACSAAYEQGQILQRTGELLAAREKLIACASDTCPAVLRGDCARWLSDVDAATPSIVIAAHGASGEDVLDVRVLVDGRVVATHLGARGIPLDPGEHALRFERAGARPIERRILLREGEKERAIDVS